MRYGIFVKLNGRTEQIVVSYDHIQRRMCARKSIEFNPRAFQGLTEDQLGSKMVSRADALIREEAESIFENGATAVAVDTAGYMIYVRRIEEPGTPFIVAVEYVLDPKILFYDEAYELQHGGKRAVRMKTEDLSEVESRFVAEHGHRLAQLLNIKSFDIADRDAQIMSALKDEPHSAACLAPGGVDDDICICGAHQRNQARRAR